MQALKPYVFIYCQNERYDLDEGDFRPILQLGGEIQHLPNVGRESHAYLEHITKRYNELADYTLFAQDASDIQLPERFEVRPPPVKFSNGDGYSRVFLGLQLRKAWEGRGWKLCVLDYAHVYRFHQDFRPAS